MIWLRYATSIPPAAPYGAEDCDPTNMYSQTVSARQYFLFDSTNPVVPVTTPTRVPRYYRANIVVTALNAPSVDATSGTADKVVLELHIKNFNTDETKRYAGSLDSRLVRPTPSIVFSLLTSAGYFKDDFTPFEILELTALSYKEITANVLSVALNSTYSTHTTYKAILSHSFNNFTSLAADERIVVRLSVTPSKINWDGIAIDGAARLGYEGSSMDQYPYPYEFALPCDWSAASVMRKFTAAQTVITITGKELTSFMYGDMWTLEFQTFTGAGVDSAFRTAGVSFHGSISIYNDDIMFSPNTTIANSGCSLLNVGAALIYFLCTSTANIGTGAVVITLTDVNVSPGVREILISPNNVAFHFNSVSAAGTTTPLLTYAVSRAEKFFIRLYILTYSYSAISLEILPAADGLSFRTVAAGNFSCYISEPMPSGTLMNFTSPYGVIDFTSATVAGDCVRSSSVTASANLLAVTLTSGLAGTTSVKMVCTVRNMVVNLLPTTARYTAADPYIFLIGAVLVKTPYNPAGVAASGYMFMRASATPTFYFHFAPATGSRYLNRDVVTQATRLITREVTLYFYATKPAAGTYTYTVSSVCTGVTLSVTSGIFTTTEAAQITTYAAFPLTHDVATLSFYPVETSCLSFTLSSGSISRGVPQSATITNTYTQYFDFVLYPTKVSIAGSSVTSAAAMPADTPLDVYLDIIIYAHTGLEVNWQFTLQTQTSGLPIEFLSTTGYTASTSSMGLIVCVPSYVSSSEIKLRQCSAISTSYTTAYMYTPRIFRIGPVRVLWGNYNTMFKTYSTAVTMMAIDKDGSAIPMQNTNIVNDMIDLSLSPPCAVVLHYQTTVNSATVADITVTTPVISVPTDQIGRAHV